MVFVIFITETEMKTYADEFIFTGEGHVQQ